MERESIKVLITNNQKEITKLYYANRDAFFNYAKKYSLGYADISDIYQEAFIALRNQAIKRNLDQVKSSLKTYLFGIGKRMIFDRLKELNKKVPLDLDLHLSKEEFNEIIIKEEVNFTKEQKVLLNCFKNLSKKCKEMLTLFYSRGLTLDEIVEMTDYANNGVVRSQKSRCLKALKELVKNY